jgi:hypothetical protein
MPEEPLSHLVQEPSRLSCPQLVYELWLAKQLVQAMEIDGVTQCGKGRIASKLTKGFGSNFDCRVSSILKAFYSL